MFMGASINKGQQINPHAPCSLVIKVKRNRKGSPLTGNTGVGARHTIQQEGLSEKIDMQMYA